MSFWRGRGVDLTASWSAVPLAKGRAWKITSPMPAALEPVNLYLFDTDDGLLLIDTGIRSKRSRQLLVDCLAEIGAELRDIRHIVLTHAHVDHTGAGASIAEGGRVTVYAHAATKAMVELGLETIEAKGHPAHPFFVQTGLDDLVIEQLFAIENYMLGTMSEPMGVERILADGDVLELSPFRFRVVETGGHCEGHIGLIEDELDLFVCGDHLHRDRSVVCPLVLYPAAPITVAPLFEHNLRDEQLRSLDDMTDLRCGRFLPGHGPEFGDVDAVLAGYRARAQERRRQIVAACAQPLSLYALSKTLFGQSADVVSLLTISETLFCGIELAREGRVRIAETDGLLTVQTLAEPPGASP